MQLTLTDSDRLVTFRTALKLAKTKYSEDPAIKTWLRIYQHGIPDLITKKGKKKEVIKGIPAQSEFAKENLIKAVRLREEGKVMPH